MSYFRLFNLREIIFYRKKYEFNFNGKKYPQKMIIGKIDIDQRSEP